jgi:hypothetical protein
VLLSLGAIAVVARGLPEPRSEINARAAGGDGFSNNATKRDGADGEHFDISKPSHSYLSFPKGRLEANAGLSKRDRDYRGATCYMLCDPAPDNRERDYDDCELLWQLLFIQQDAEFTVGPRASPFLFHFRRIKAPG